MEFSDNSDGFNPKEDISKQCITLKKVAFYCLSPVLVPMNFCFSIFWTTCLVFYKSLLEPFVHKFLGFWNKRKKYGFIDLLRKTFKAFFYMIGRVILSPFILVISIPCALYSSVVCFKTVGDYISSNKAFVDAVNIFKSFNYRSFCVIDPCFWLPIKTDDDEHLNTGFAAILGYTFGIYRFDALLLEQPNVIGYSYNYRRPPDKKQAQSQLAMEYNRKRERSSAPVIDRNSEELFTTIG